MTSKNETEISINNNQDYDNTFNNLKSDALKINNNQTKNAEKNVILNINQTEPNLKINNIYGNYNIEIQQKISKDNLPRNIINSNYYPNTEDNRISKGLKNVKSNQIIKEKSNSDNILDNSVPLQKNVKSIELQHKINQSDDKITGKEKYVSPSDNKDNKKCKKCCCKAIRIILKVLVYLLLILLYLLFMLVMMFGGCSDDFRDCENCITKFANCCEEICKPCRRKCECCDKCYKYIFK